MSAIFTEAAHVVASIKSGDRVFIHGSAATPHHLLRALAARSAELKGVEIVSISTLGAMPLTEVKQNDAFFINSLFVSENVRQAVNSAQGGYVPVFLSEIGQLFRSGILEPDVAIVHVSEPDQHGYCSLGVSADIAIPAVETAKIVLAQVNKQMPRTHGAGHIHMSRIHAFVEIDESLPEVDYSQKISEKEEKIGAYIAELIEDRSTLQMGIGGIPDATLRALSQHKDLGIHTEMFSNGLLPLIQSGVVTNAYKKKHPGKVVTAFAIGNRELYNFLHDNPLFSFQEAAYVNDTSVIRKNPKVVSINSCLELDLTGQVCADSIGSYHYSGVGGQMDFMRGAALSKGGKPIMALASTTRKGESKINPFLRTGAGVVTTRAHMHYVVTEYGVAYLYGKNLRQRAYALMEIAHPDHRENLEREIVARFGSYKYTFR
ncbi:MAG: acetyl-CoA hydrolase/transferase family protein [Nitritalea sp.]